MSNWQFRNFNAMVHSLQMHMTLILTDILTLRVSAIPCVLHATCRGLYLEEASAHCTSGDEMAKLQD